MTVVNATSLQQALEALRDHPGARLVQGGTDVMVEGNFNRTTLHDVVALRRVNELRRWHVSEDSQTIRLGAG
ncbi:MAG: FAD binding domain-containing protein, partial [Ilumatobacteraceae bacterium]